MHFRPIVWPLLSDEQLDLFTLWQVWGWFPSFSTPTQTHTGVVASPHNHPFFIPPLLPFSNFIELFGNFCPKEKRSLFSFIFLLSAKTSCCILRKSLTIRLLFWSEKVIIFIHFYAIYCLFSIDKLC